VVKGKFSYLSPEAASGKDVDRRADIFAVGILLYELLTGKRLFYGETDYQTVELVRQAKVPPISPQNPEVQPELEAVIRKALSKDLSARYQSAGDLQDALAQVLFSQRLKVTSRDIEQLVKGVLAEKQKNKPADQPIGNLIDTLINEEIMRFTSLDGINEPSATTSPSPTDEGNAPLDPGSFVDTRGWADDMNTGNVTRNGKPRSRKDSSGIVTAGLEDLLEGDGTLTPEPKGRPRFEPTPRTPPSKSPQPAGAGKLILLVLTVLVALAGAGLAAYFLTKH
jgi:serine/threonine-protein kinase